MFAGNFFTYCNCNIAIFFVFSQKDYVCFDFVPRHHNVIRYRKGVAVITDDFHTVCSWVAFQNKEQWKYNLFLGKILSVVISNNCVFILQY